ncbi:hypothetical protein H4Q26_015778 [Puccinia striiformis f. sp. tritici PST-130]|nr:hypothetical protein H4Q26_015778 [Puccinia striiformis f. sp. tritici PST-130]
MPIMLQPARTSNMFIVFQMLFSQFLDSILVKLLQVWNHLIRLHSSPTLDSLIIFPSTISVTSSRIESTPNYSYDPWEHQEELRSKILVSNDLVGSLVLIHVLISFFFVSAATLISRLRIDNGVASSVTVVNSYTSTQSKIPVRPCNNSGISSILFVKVFNILYEGFGLVLGAGWDVARKINSGEHRQFGATQINCQDIVRDDLPATIHKNCHGGFKDGGNIFLN